MNYRFYINKTKGYKVRVFVNGRMQGRTKYPFTLQRIDKPLITKDFKTLKDCEEFLLSNGYEKDPYPITRTKYDY